MAKSKIIDIDRAIYLYNKYKSLNRVALSLDCSPNTLKKVFINNGIELKKRNIPKWTMKYSEKYIN